MNEEYKVPLGIVLTICGIFFIFMTFRFVPVPDPESLKGTLNMFWLWVSAFGALGLVLFIYIFRLIMYDQRPLPLFGLCIGLFLIFLVLIRVFGVR